MSNVSEFFDDNEIKEQVEQVWAGTFQATYRILKSADLFAFEEIEIKSNPNIHQLISAALTLEFMLDSALGYLQSCEDIDHSVIRMILNAKHQISHMQAIVTALKTKDRDMYDTAIKRLGEQAPF